VSIDGTALETYVTATAAAIGLPIPTESVPLVAENVQRLLAAGAVIIEFALPDDLDPASIFQP
jgi:1-carboxybiuret hydrolase subunit AtzG-like protein